VKKKNGKTETRMLFKKQHNKPGIVVHICNPSTQETEIGGPRVQSQPQKSKQK
jgi:hypothetical protein